MVGNSENRDEFGSMFKIIRGLESVIVEPFAKTPRCTVNCTVESGEHVVHSEHGELSSRSVSKAIFVSYDESISYESLSHYAHNPKVAGSNPAPATNLTMCDAVT